jgi:hypothetical protein
MAEGHSRTAIPLDYWKTLDVGIVSQSGSMSYQLERNKEFYLRGCIVLYSDLKIISYGLLQKYLRD